METSAEDAVFEVLQDSPPSETNLLVVSYRDDPDDWIADWRAHGGTIPADFGFIHVGETARSTATAAGIPTSASPKATPQFLTGIGDPTDLTGLGIQISQYLDQWTGTDNQILVYVDSLTALLQFVELNRVFRFLHVLTGRIKSVDAHAYYRLDLDAHDSQTVATIQTLMDETRRLS